MNASPAGTISQAGFTLIEMLVVMVIVATTVAVALPLFNHPSARLRLEATINDLLGALRATRSISILRNTETVLSLNVDQRFFASPVVSRRNLPSDVVVKLRFASVEQERRAEGGFRFFPDGSSTGGEVTLMLANHKMAICIDWATGRARRGQC